MPHPSHRANASSVAVASLAHHRARRVGTSLGVVFGRRSGLVVDRTSTLRSNDPIDPVPDRSTMPVGGLA
jgi:hypothetical protein